MKATRVPDSYTVTIEGMTAQDAAVIRRVCDRVGGTPAGPRGAIDRLRAALSEAGVKRAENIKFSGETQYIEWEPITIIGEVKK